MKHADLINILHAVQDMEHKTAVKLTDEQYWSIVRLCQKVEAPQFLTDYFARKANTATPLPTL